MKVGVVDYEAGNLRSVELALQHLSIDYILSKNPSELAKALEVSSTTPARYVNL